MLYGKYKITNALWFALLFWVASFAPVYAETVVYTDTVPLQTTNWDKQLSLPRFDPTMGILTAIEFLLSGQVNGTAKIENLDAAPAIVTAESFATVRVERPDGSFITHAIPSASRRVNLTEFDGTIDFAGTSGRIISGITGLDISERTILTNSRDLFAFSGDTPITLQMNTTGASRASGAGNLGLSFQTLASAAITVTYHFEQPAIGLKKATNGFDADLAPGPFVLPGAAVTWTYTVTNIGNVPLVDLSLVDDQEGDVTVGCPQRTLAIGEAIICTAQGIARLGQYTNTAIVTGTVLPALPGEPRHVSATDPSHYFATTAPLCPPTGGPSAALLYLGEGVGDYLLPVNFEHFVVKKFSPLRFEIIDGPLYSSTRQRGAPERVWACRGNCNFSPAINRLLPIGTLPAGTNLQLAVLDDDHDDRINLLIANGILTEPVVRIEEQRLLEELTFVLPFTADWGFYAADSIGVNFCVEP